MSTIGEQMAQAHRVHQALEVEERCVEEARTNVEAKLRYPHIDDPIRAINFALDKLGDDPFDTHEFLSAWREGSWDELVRTWPEFAEKCR